MPTALETIRRSLCGNHEVIVIIEERTTKAKGEFNELVEFFVAPANPTYDVNALKAFSETLVPSLRTFARYGFWKKSDYRFGELCFKEESEEDGGSISRQISVRVFPSQAVSKYVHEHGTPRSFMSLRHIAEFERNDTVRTS